jgi:hypothetical protein
VLSARKRTSTSDVRLTAIPMMAKCKVNERSLEKHTVSGGRGDLGGRASASRSARGAQRRPPLPNRPLTLHPILQD